MTSRNEVSHYALILNPAARSGRSKRIWPKIRRLLDAAQVSYTVHPSEYSGHAVEIAKRQAEAGVDVVVAVGGDGTINQVLSGLMRAKLARNSQTALGILYTGTSPDVCRFHRIPIEHEQAVRVLLANHRSSIDVGEIRYQRYVDAQSESQIDWFLCSVNLGMGARIAEGSNAGLRRYLGDTLGTFVSLFKTALRFEPSDVVGTLDGQSKVLNRALNVTIGKNPHLASGIRLGVDVAADDGLLYLFAVQNFTFWGLLAQAKRLYRGTFQEHPNNYLRRITRCSFDEFSGANTVEFDGDARGFLPCSVRVLPKTLELLVPGRTHTNGPAL